ncbi:hypothetical protein ACQPYK_32170 [Streptosporangium sp. CA-135522]|uniref:hypothetical protein n=1 Tax=Streptosporangium sp. CA-135522 TaxID=3240072 RepID=UPI003D937A07
MRRVKPDPADDQARRVFASAQHLADNFENYPLMPFAFVQHDPVGFTVDEPLWREQP